MNKTIYDRVYEIEEQISGIHGDIVNITQMILALKKMIEKNIVVKRKRGRPKKVKENK